MQSDCAVAVHSSWTRPDFTNGSRGSSLDVIAIGQHLFALVFTCDACADLRANRSQP